MSLTNEPITTHISDNVRRLLRHVLRQPEGSASFAGKGAKPNLRSSKGLREFCNTIRSPEGLQILDLGAASQANINFITGLGHRLCTEDVYRSLQTAASRPFRPPEPDEEPEEARFLRENLRYPPGQFDAILCWDLLDLLPDAVVKPMVERLYQLLKPGGSLLTFFHTGQVGQMVPICYYRICSQDELQVQERGQDKLRRSFNNRGIETLFRSFASLKFYLTKDSLREVVVVR
jgi:hypothetical protein